MLHSHCKLCHSEWTYRTLPPQNWQSSPCQPSGQTQVPLMQTPPFIHDVSLMHFPTTTLLQKNNITINTTNKTNKHFRWFFVEKNILNIWAKMFSIFQPTTFSLPNCLWLQNYILWCAFRLTIRFYFKNKKNLCKEPFFILSWLY